MNVHWAKVRAGPALPILSGAAIGAGGAGLLMGAGPLEIAGMIAASAAVGGIVCPAICRARMRRRRPANPEAPPVRIE